MKWTKDKRRRLWNHALLTEEKQQAFCVLVIDRCPRIAALVTTALHVMGEGMQRRGPRRWVAAML